MTSERELATDTPTRSGLLRAMSIVEVIADNMPKRLGVSALSRATGISKAVAHRMLKELTSIGFLSFDDNEKRYGLGSLALTIGLAAIRDLDIERIARPHLVELSSHTGETATLSVIEGDYRMYVHQVESPKEISMSVTLGVQYPLYAGASSKVILATFPPEQLDEYFARVKLAPLTDSTVTKEAVLRDELSRIRTLGYSVSLGERHAGSASVAAAILGDDGEASGSISVSGPLIRFPESIQAIYGELVNKHAAEISRDLGLRINNSAP